MYIYKYVYIYIYTSKRFVSIAMLKYRRVYQTELSILFYKGMNEIICFLISAVQALYAVNRYKHYTLVHICAQ